jgi:hypothetical protein
MRKSLITSVCLLSFAFAAIHSARGSVIKLTGGDPGEGFDVNTLAPGGYAPQNGTVYAYHLTSAGHPQETVTDVIQNVSFTPWLFNGSAPNVTQTNGTGYPSAPASFGGTPTSNDDALSAMATSFWYAPADPLTIRMGGLVIGKSYQVDVFWYWNSGTWPDYYKFTDASGPQATVDLVPGVGGNMYDVRETLVAVNDGNGVGRIILEAYKAPGNTDAPYITAFSVTEHVPEPTSIAAIGFGAVTLLARRRGRNRHRECLSAVSI